MNLRTFTSQVSHGRHDGKGVGTSPKVRGPVKLPPHLEQKQTPLGNISVQICALLVLVNCFPYKLAFKKEGKEFKNNFGRKVRGPMAPWPLQFLRQCMTA